jgi:TPR repeat protein
MSADPQDEIDIAASYSRRDAAVVVPILDALKARGVKVWFDKNIPGGAIWEETITRNMRRAKAVVFFVSKESLLSDRCFDEVSAARTLKRQIIPVLVEPVRMPDDLPDRLVLTLQTRNTVDAWPGAEGDPVDQIMRALASFGVRGDPKLEAAPVVPASAAAPAAVKLVTAKRGSRTLLIGAVAGVALAVAAGALALSGVFGGSAGGKSGKLEIASDEWCSVSAPALIAKAEAQIGMERLLQMAGDGDRDAQTLQCLSGNKACTGGGDTSGLPAAYAACEAAGAKGSWRAVFNQGWMKQRGCGVSLDAKGAAAAVMRAAEGGCAMAQFYLGTLYDDGELIAYDQAASIKWLTEAANQNYPPAMNRLGSVYALGRGVPEDDVRATDLYRRAADLGDARAMLNYARALEMGVGTEKNSGAAITYYRRAAQSDDAEMKQLALDSLKRLGVSP